MLRECSEITEVAVMDISQVGVRTRARAIALSAVAATTSGTSKKRKVINQELKMSTSYIRRRRVKIRPENSVSVSASPEVNSGDGKEKEDRCSSPSLDHASASCCSSNGSSERIKFADLEDESVEVEVETSTYYSGRKRDRNPSSELQQPELSEDDDLDSTARPTEADSHRRSPMEKMPTDLELEEFFAESEKDLQKQFAEKYNYDIVKDEPLQGRYEWIRLKP